MESVIDREDGLELTQYYNIPLNQHKIKQKQSDKAKRRKIRRLHKYWRRKTHTVDVV